MPEVAEDPPAPRRTEPGLGPYRGPVVVLALLAAIVIAGLLISLVGAVRAPDDVSNSATVLGTFPIDPDAEGIPAGPASQQGGSTLPGGGTAPPPPTTGGSPGSAGPTDTTAPSATTGRTCRASPRSTCPAASP